MRGCGADGALACHTTQRQVCEPWNYPLEEIILLCIPALIAGNAVVVKPSEVVPLSSGCAVTALQLGLNSSFPGLVGLVQCDGGVGAWLRSVERAWWEFPKERRFPHARRAPT